MAEQNKFEARGPISSALLKVLNSSPAESQEMLASLPDSIREVSANSQNLIYDDDLQLSLLILQSLHYGSLLPADDAWEWNPTMTEARNIIENEFEKQLRLDVSLPPLPAPDAESVSKALFALTSPQPGPSQARYIAKEAKHEEIIEFVILRSVYTLKEADPQTWAIPRLEGRAKAALVEIQTDEYGAGRKERMHSEIFARLMRSLGLDSTYGAYLDLVPAITIASFTMMGLFGMNRRLRGAMAGHYAAYEMTSSLPNRLLGDGFRRFGYGSDVTDYFDEHVEADAIHEQIAGRDLAGGVVEGDSSFLTDVMFGANASLTIDGWAGERALNRWQQGQSALRKEPLAGLGIP